ncbi:hypothetical protein [uncultured Roseibium sp.]|uniref:hypothetical protein n=1 Tax=uncultured Roseibium sp. TaxID=1936171 RepID=UPI00261B785B|nr:hypothetical protein [uncultured Roseibium sp.]
MTKDPKGMGVLNRAEHGRLRKYCLALLCHMPHAPATQIRSLAISEFGSQVRVGKTHLPMPSIRTFQNTLKNWKIEYRHEISALRKDRKFSGRAGK